MSELNHDLAPGVSHAVGHCAAALRRHLTAPVLLPGDDLFAGEVAGFELTITHRPDIVVVVQRPTDIEVAVRIASEHDLPVAVTGTGHGPLTPVRSGLLLNVRQLTRVTVDTAAGTAVCAAGATWYDVLDAATPFGLAPVCGSAPGVGVVGFLLGGGLGPLARSVGFGSDHVVSFQVVLADGSTCTASDEAHRDLFWALRGGRFGLGVVTAVTLRLLRLSALSGASEYYPASAIPALLESFRQFTAADLMSQLTVSVAVIRLPAHPSLPPVLRGRTVGHLRAAYVASPIENRGGAADCLARLRADLPVPLSGWLGTIPYSDIDTVHQDPTVPAGHVTAGALLDTLGPGTVQAILETAGPDAPTAPGFVEVRHYGGAVQHGTGSPDAVSGRDAAYGVWLSTPVSAAPRPTGSSPGDQDCAAAAAASIRGVRTALAPWSMAGLQANFVGSENDPDQVAAMWPSAVAARLSAVRRRYGLTSRFGTVPDLSGTGHDE